METTKYYLVVVKTERTAEDAAPVHTAKKVELAAGKLGDFAGKDEGAMIDAFKRFVNGEAAAPAAAPGPAPVSGSSSDEAAGDEAADK